MKKRAVSGLCSGFGKNGRKVQTDFIFVGQPESKR